MTANPIRIAMWSGPRNLSTAMMRSFGARADTSCVDEPFYAPYLNVTGHIHPLQEDILDQHETDPRRVIEQLTRQACPTPIQYQKHLTHHMIPEIPRDWFGAVRHAFLIRHPARVLASYARKMETVSLEAIGLPQQVELFDQVSRSLGRAPHVLDCDAVLNAPQAQLDRLCQALEIPFDPAMLRWSAGPKPEDGAWAPHWYDAVNASTGFARPPGALPKLPEDWDTLLRQALALYAQLFRHTEHI